MNERRNEVSYYVSLLNTEEFEPNIKAVIEFLNYTFPRNNIDSDAREERLYFKIMLTYLIYQSWLMLPLDRLFVAIIAKLSPVIESSQYRTNLASNPCFRRYCMRPSSKSVSPVAQVAPLSQNPKDPTDPTDEIFYTPSLVDLLLGSLPLNPSHLSPKLRRSRKTQKIQQMRFFILPAL